MTAMRDVLANLLLTLAALAIAFAIAEVGVRTLAPQNLSGSWRVKAPAGYYVNKSEGTARHQFCDRVVTYRFFAPHLRDTPPRNADTTVLVVGESFTFGWLLDAEATYVGILQRRLDATFGVGAFHLLNAAVPAWGTAHYVRFVEDFGATIRPDVVLVFVNSDDIGRSMTAGLYDLSGVELTPSMQAAETSLADIVKAVLNALPGYEWAIEHSHAIQLVRMWFLNETLSTACAATTGPAAPDQVPVPMHDGPPVDPRQAEATGQALFRRLHAWCRQNGAELLVVTTGWSAFRDSNPRQEPTDAFLATAEGFFGAEGIAFFDAGPHMARHRANASTLAFKGDAHPNEDGARAIADAVWDWLRAELRRRTD